MTQLYGTLPNQVPTNADLGTMAFQDALAFRQTTQTPMTFASLPLPNTVPQWTQYFISDVGTHGSTWISDGTAWQLVGGVANLFQNTLPMGVPSSGTITVTTGALTLVTALDNIYPSIYMWFPAGAWTGSTAGMYYVAMTSTTVGTVYSNQYTGGVATIPISPTLVTTGAGAYVQTTGVYNAVLSYAMQAGVMGATGELTAKFTFSANNSAGLKYLDPMFSLIGASGSISLSTGLASTKSFTMTNVSASKQVAVVGADNSNGAINFATSNTSVSFSLTPKAYLAVATDWIILQSYQIQLSR